MKYQSFGEMIPQNARAEINGKILSLINSDTAEQEGVSREDIFNAYTGDGGLHGLKFSDFGSYSEYGQAKREIENGQFFTPAPVCQLIMESLHLRENDAVADLTCGMGNFANWIPTESNFYGCELDYKAHQVAQYLYPKANLENKDIRSYKPDILMDYVVGNPPFNLTWCVNGASVLSQLYYFQKAAEVLKPLGIVAAITPMSFLADEFSDKAMIQQIEEHFSFLGQFALDKDTFLSLGVTGYPTKVIFLQKKMDLPDWNAVAYSTKVDVLPKEELNAESIYNRYVAKAQDLFLSHRPNVLLELAKGRSAADEFLYQVNRYLYHIKHNPKLSEKYSQCQKYLHKFQTQEKPDDMSYEEWARVQITETKVLAYLRQTIKKQNRKPYRDEIRLVKRDYSIGNKAYSPKMAKIMKKDDAPIYELVSRHNDPAAYGPYAKMLRRRQREYDIAQTPVSEMTEDKEIAEWLNALTFFDQENGETIRLNEMQKQDINTVIQKRYFMLQWKQGCGKTLAGIATALYRMQFQNCFCTWVVSNAISIKNNWNIVLPNYDIPCVLIRKMSDLEKIKQGDFVLVTFNALMKYRKQIKKWIKIHNKKVFLCLDESDEISNPSSARCKATLDVFRRCKSKLLMTGTSTRNNIAEFAPQLELAYNNSANMISWCSAIYSYEKEKGETEPVLVKDSNDYYGMPIPAYKKGYRLFSACYQPEKVTVFGVGKRNQDIFNAEDLKEILERFTITRSFEEVVGKDLLTIHQVPVNFCEEERFIYTKAINEFESMRNSYFASTGNSRKDGMLKLIQQITLLLRISAAPNTIAEYDGPLPNKIATVLDMLAERPNEVVAIGVRHKAVVEAYQRAIETAFPQRSLFVVTGDTTSLAQRRALKQKLKDSKNGILLCTQQSLPSSVNYEFVNEVIIPELHYNNSQMSQFYFRFIRYNSKHLKHVHFVTYLGSIESNLMQMVLAKEKLNLFMRQNETDMDSIYEQFGVDYDLLSALMLREQDKDGVFHISWGQQNIA